MAQWDFLFCYHLYHSSKLILWLLTCKAHEEVKKPLRPQQKSEKRGGVNVNVCMWMEDIRKLLPTFEPPSFVIAENHGTVTAHRQSWRHETKILFEEYVTVQIAEKRVKQKEGKQFSRMRFLSVRFVSLFPMLAFLCYDLVQIGTNNCLLYYIMRI